MTKRAVTATFTPLLLAVSLLAASWAASVPGASAQIAEWTVLAGWEDLDSGIEVQAFLPENITISEGDTVTWRFVPEEAHTVTFLGEEEQPDLIVAVPDGAVVFNPAAALPLGGPQYDGSFPTNSGMPIYDPDAGDEPTFKLEFTTPGTYGYICYFHPNMTGTVTVLAEGSIVPFDQLTYDVIAVRERRTFISELEALKAARGPIQKVEKRNGTIEHRLLTGLSTTKVDEMRFVDEEVEIEAGDTVTWSWTASQSPHTVSFVPDGEEPPTLILAEPENDPPLPPTLNPAVFNPSGGDRLPAEGVVSSGFRLNPSLDPDSAGTYSLIFSKPGVYSYVCLLHPAQGHAGRIVVTERLDENPRAAVDDTFGPTVGLPKVGGTVLWPWAASMLALFGLGLTGAGGYFLRRKTGG
ncbi:MAG: hypothetical protein O3A47_03375 [Chloroflexi bacterium]|nr:hypothetical protein [Chloroflexota bacterium]